jgi:peptidoglycan/xylan/chitin deacetylase (PgdA/CDA1 family)
MTKVEYDRRPARRLVLLSAAALVLSGCRPGTGATDQSPPAPTPELTAPALPKPPTSVPDISHAPAPPLASPNSGPPLDPVPSQDRITAEFFGRLPSYWGLEAPKVPKTLPDPAAGIALTLDFCGGPGGNGTDHAVLHMLQRLHIPATLFLNARWTHTNPAQTRDLAANPLFELANHGTRHTPLSVTGKTAYGIPGTNSSAEVYEEIMANDALLTAITGQRPRFFRPGTAFLDDIAAEITLALGSIPAGFSINADGGATYPPASVASETAKARPGDIILAHGNHPGAGTASGLSAAIPALLEKGYSFTTLGAAFP